MATRRNITMGARGLVFVVFAFFLSGCLPNELSGTDGTFTIIYTLVSKERVDRTHFDYTYEGSIVTSGGDETGVKAVPTSSVSTTVIIDGFFMFPGASTVATDSFDTFTLRQDRTVEFDPADIAWTITGMNIPADPGDAGEATLEGIDSDNDGVRDDIQRYIALTYPESARVRAAATQDALVFQAAIQDAGTDRANSRLVGNEMSRSTNCTRNMLELLYTDTNELLAVKRELGLTLERLAANTDLRARQYLGYAAALGGTINSVQPLGSSVDCDFDPTILPD